METTQSQEQEMELVISRNTLIIWGILISVAGFFLLTRPAITATIWVEIMAITWLVGGIFELVHALNERGERWGWRLLSAVVSILAGLYIIGNPVIGTLFTVQIAFIFFAFSALMDGVLNILSGFRIQQGKRWMVIILGVVQAIIGIWLLLHPIAGMLSLVPILGILMIVGGIIVISGAFRLA